MSFGLQSTQGIGSGQIGIYMSFAAAIHSRNIARNDNYVAKSASRSIGLSYSAGLSD